MDTANKVESISNWAQRAKAWANKKEVADHSSAPFVMYSANVTNTGTATSDVSVLLFLSSSAPDTPKQELIGYVHVHALHPQQSKVVYFDVNINSILAVDDNGDRWLQPADYQVFIGYASHAELKHSFQLAGERTLIQQWPRRQEQKHEEGKQVDASQHKHSRKQ